MQKTISIAVLSLFTILLVASCKKNDSSSNNTACTNNASPWLADGHKNAYKVTDVNGVHIADSLFINYLSDSAGIFKTSSAYDNGAPTYSYLQCCGNSIYSGQVSSLSDRQETYRLTGNVGETWTNTQTSNGGIQITTTNTISALNTSVTVPKGTFSCTKITAVSSYTYLGVPYSLTTDFYLDAQKGIVKALGTTVHYELVSTNF